MATPNTVGSLLSALYADPEEIKKRAVFNKGLAVPGLDASEWRWDVDSNLMKYSEHGQLTEYGWEIDHHLPSALGGGDQYDNLRPLHWRNNRRRGGLIGALLNR
jgi:hypothetical protein